MAASSRRPRRPDHVLDDAMADGHVLLDPSTGEYFRVEGTGAAVWELCDGDRDEAAIVSEVARRYGVAPDRVAGDVARFVDACAAAGLLVLGADPEPG